MGLGFSLACLEMGQFFQMMRRGKVLMYVGRLGAVFIDKIGWVSKKYLEKIENVGKNWVGV